MRSEIGIIYSAPMILARKANRKSQSRRLVRIAKVYEPDFGKPILDKAWIDTSYLKPEFGNVPCLKIRFDGNGQADMETVQRHFPRWEPGDLLVARETYTVTAWKQYPKFHSLYRLTGYYNADNQKFQIFLNKAESKKFGRRKRKTGTIPAIFMYRSLSRFTDEVTKVRVQRVQKITEKDAKAEGVNNSHAARWPDGDPGYIYDVLRRNYSLLWNSLHGLGAWDRNDWVWVIEFKPAPPVKRRTKRWLDRRFGARR